MNTYVVRMPKYPECWDSCGSCANGNVFVLEVLVSPGERIERDTNILTLETGKVALDIPSTHAGVVLEVYVTAGDTLPEKAPLILLNLD